MTDLVKKKQQKQMSEAEKLQNYKIIQLMNQQINYTKNPRYAKTQKPKVITELPLDPCTSKTFSAEPEVIIFQDYLADNIYQIPLTLTNRSHRFQRIRIIPPQTSQFSVTDIRYPNKDSGDIASGMSVQMNINFNASSLQNFQDLIQIITEDDVLNIQITARKEQPSLNLQETLIMPSTFLGDHSEQVFKVTNKGGAAGFKMIIDGLDEDHEEETVHLKHFSIFPTHFYLQKGESINLQVMFHPQSEGQIEEQFTLICDNLTSATYTLKSVSNMVEFEVMGIDHQLFQKGDKFDIIYFQNAFINCTMHRELIIKNITLVEINYHWDIFMSKEQSFSVQEGPKIFWIEPSSGTFPPGSQIKFNIFFNGLETMPYFQKLAMVIEDVPLESVKNFNTSLKDHERSSLTYLNFDLIGLMCPVDLELTPSSHQYAETLTINHDYKQFFYSRHNVYIKNHSKAITNFKIILKEKSHEQLSYTMDFEEVFMFIQGKLSEEESVKITINIKSTVISDNQQLIFWVQFDSNEIKTFSIQANFIGPQIRIIEPLVDYEIIRTYSKNVKTINIQNESDQNCEILCLNSEPDKNLRTKPQIKDYIEMFTYKRFRPVLIQLGPNEKKQISLQLSCQDTEVFNQFIQFNVKDGASHILEIYAEIQEVFVSLNRYQLNFKELYLGEKYEISQNDEQSIILYNRGNIPTSFRWVHKDLNNIKYNFEPSNGIIQPKQQIPINMKFTATKGPDVDDIFICQVDSLEHPLGIQLTTKVLGLDVKCQLTQPQQIFVPQNPNLTQQSSLSKSNIQLEAQPLELIDFTASQIKQISTLKFKLVNTSGINTKYDISFQQYEPLPFRDEKNQKKRNISEKSMRSSSKTNPQDSLNSSLRNTSYKLEEKIPIIKQFQRNSQIYLASNLGISMTCEPSFGDLKANKQIEVKITLYNDICGIFNDTLIINIDGLKPIEIPVKIKVTGSPIMLAPNQVGINLSGEYPTINLGTIVKGSDTITKAFNLMNNGPKDAEIDIKLYNIDTDLYRGTYMFNIKFVEPLLGSEDLVKVFFEPIEPNIVIDDPCIQITPRKTNIMGRSIENFKIDFVCDQIRKFNFLLVLTPNLIHDKSQKLNIVPILLTAETIQPRLLLDKKVDFNNNQTIKFQRWSYGESEKDIQSFHLINDTNTNLIFTLDTTGPFKIIESNTNSTLKYNNFNGTGMSQKKVASAFNLSQASSCQLKILFEKDGDWPMNYRSYKKGMINIKYHNNDTQQILLDGLLLRPNIKLNMNGYENNEGSDTINFQVVHVRNHKFISFFICNQTKVPAKWKLQQVKYPKLKSQGLRTMTELEKEDDLKVEDASVFDFSVTEGIINGPSVPLQKIPNGQVFSTMITDGDNQEKNLIPQEIKIRFMVIIFIQPKKSVLYKCKYRIMVEEGPYQDFILKGMGTLDEIKEI